MDTITVTAREAQWELALSHEEIERFCARAMIWTTANCSVISSSLDSQASSLFLLTTTAVLGAPPVETERRSRQPRTSRFSRVDPYRETVPTGDIL
jgi:hypothetical protein